MKEFYLYSEKNIHNTIKEMFTNFKIKTISIEEIKESNFINQNILHWHTEFESSSSFSYLGTHDSFLLSI